MISILYFLCLLGRQVSPGFDGEPDCDDEELVEQEAEAEGAGGCLGEMLLNEYAAMQNMDDEIDIVMNEIGQGLVDIRTQKLLRGRHK